ncbi:hypothetical protein [Acidovorax sp. Root219]|uniref:hypothetical protein n=1 Tax=Acidovorax sp. Root219 TaxID=1736493 RepID=UPI0007096849|nr:hypothetical protein [Acidovorax sp. Root219]KRC36233.1 hypothetical protein ASE28_01480 [Acidovorax sp. Root219]
MAKAQPKAAAAAAAEEAAGSNTDIDVQVQQHGFSGQTVEIKLFKGEANEPTQPFFGINNYQIQVQREKWVRVPVEMADHIEGLTYSVREPDPEFPDDPFKARWVDKPRFPLQRKD